MGTNTKNQISISGPVNLIRLEGNILGIKKSLYVFADIHMGCGEETRCANIFSETIMQYLIRQFDMLDPNKPVDFFLETFSKTMVSKSIYTSIYIINLRQLVASSIAYAETNGKRIMKSSEVFPNVRFHYIDIRDHILLGLLLNEPRNISGNIEIMLADLTEKYIIPKIETIEHVKNLSNIFAAQIKALNDIFSSVLSGGGSKPSFKSSMELNPDYEQFIIFINKILNKYTHPENKKIIGQIITDLVLPLLTYITNTVNKMKEILDRIKNPIIPAYVLNTKVPNPEIPETIKYSLYGTNRLDMFDELSKLIKLSHSLMETSMCLSSTIVDLFFLRRFIDKDYITRGLSYTGLFHSLNIIRILTKYFGWKVTHTGYSAKSIGETNKILSDKSTKFSDISQLFTPPELYQCTNITGFPEKFE